MYDDPYEKIFQIIFIFIPIFMAFFFRKYPARYKLAKCAFAFFICCIPVYILAATLISVFIIGIPSDVETIRETMGEASFYGKIITILLAIPLTCYKCRAILVARVYNPWEWTKKIRFLPRGILLHAMSILITAGSLYLLANSFGVVFIITYLCWGFLFYLHFTPEPVSFISSNLWFFFTLTIFFFMFIFLPQNAYFLSIFLLAPVIFHLAVTIHYSFLVSGKTLFKNKYSYLYMALFILPFLSIPNPLNALLSAFLEDYWNLKPTYLKYLAFLLLGSFSYICFLKLKRILLKEKVQPETKDITADETQNSTVIKAS